MRPGSVGTLLPQLFLVGLGTGVGPACLRQRFGRAAIVIVKGAFALWVGLVGVLADAGVGMDTDSEADGEFHVRYSP